MNELLITRLRTARIDKNMKQQEVADILGIKPNTLSNWEKGRTEPDIDTFVKLCDIYEIDCASLLADVYAFKRVKSDISLTEYEYIKKYRDLDSHGARIVDFILQEEWERSTSEKEKQLSDSEPTRLINYYYRLASAGTGQILFDMPPTKKIEIPDTIKNRKADYAIGVNGNSMKPRYCNGDMLLVEMTDEIELGEIGIFSVNNECYVKQLGKGELISLNPEYDNIPLNETAKCMGKVIDKL